MTRKQQAKKRPPKRTLTMISGLLCASALLRLGLAAGEAIALEDTTEAVPLADATQTSCETPEKLQALLDEFRIREEKIKSKEARMDKRAQALEVSDEKIEAKLASLIDAEEKLRATMALSSTAAEDDLSKLTSVYENMKPKEAAALFEQMAPEFSAGFLGRMKPEAAAAIMTGLSSERAYSISVILAGRNAETPRK